MAGTGTTTYSAKDTTGAFVHPTAGTFQLAGVSQGAKQYVVSNATERTAHDTAADGAVMVSYVAGDSGALSIECQQTSAIHKFLLSWFNLVKTAADGGDVSQWAAATVALRNILDGSVHVLNGVSPAKIPDKTYAAQGGNVTWSLMAANVQNL